MSEKKQHLLLTVRAVDENGNPCVAPDAKWDATAQYDKEEGEE